MTPASGPQWARVYALLAACAVVAALAQLRQGCGLGAAGCGALAAVYARASARAYGAGDGADP